MTFRSRTSLAALLVSVVMIGPLAPSPPPVMAQGYSSKEFDDLSRAERNEARGGGADPEITNPARLRRPWQHAAIEPGRRGFPEQDRRGSG